MIVSHTHIHNRNLNAVLKKKLQSQKFAITENLFRFTIENFLEPVISNYEGNGLARWWCETLARLLSWGNHGWIQLSRYLLPVLRSFDQNHGEDELIQIQLPVSVAVGQLPNLPQSYVST